MRLIEPKLAGGHFRPWIVAGGTASSIILLILFINMGGLYKKNALLYVIVFGIED